MPGSITTGQGAPDRFSLLNQVSGGKWADAARSFDPRSLRIVIKPGPWRFYWQGEWIWVGGLTEGRNIRVAILTLGGWSNPGGAYLNTLYAYLRWEIGNALGFAAGAKGEIGTHSPSSV
jgi:hypothetical protein